MEKRPNNYFDGIPIHRSQIVILFIVVLAYFFDQMDNMVLGYVAPSVMKTFGITMQEFAPAQSLYFIGMMFGGIVAGLVSDKIGRRKAFMCGCSLFTIATILTPTGILWIYTKDAEIIEYGAIYLRWLIPTYSAFWARDPSASPICPKCFPPAIAPSGPASASDLDTLPYLSSVLSPHGSSPCRPKPGASCFTRECSASCR